MEETQKPVAVESKPVAELAPPGTAASSVRAEGEKLAVRMRYWWNCTAF